MSTFVSVCERKKLKGECLILIVLHFAGGWKLSYRPLFNDRWLAPRFAFILGYVSDDIVVLNFWILSVALNLYYIPFLSFSIYFYAITKNFFLFSLSRGELQFSGWKKYTEDANWMAVRREKLFLLKSLLLKSELRWRGGDNKFFIEIKNTF